jgi:glucosylceramidase
MLKKILTINPNIKIIATPWSPPVWMKDNGSSIGGSLKPEYYGVYAQYFVKYIQEMKKTESQLMLLHSSKRTFTPRK